MRTYTKTFLFFLLLVPAAWALPACEVVDGEDESDFVEPEGTASVALFDLDAARATPNDNFYDFPFPHGLRVTPEGHPDMTDIPATNTSLVETALEVVQAERPGFSPSAGLYFRFDQPLDAATFPDLAASMLETSSVQLINIDTDSPGYGERLPVYITFQTDRTAFWRTNMLAVRPMYGRTMRSGTTYAVALTRGLRSFDGGPVRPAPAFEEIVAGTATGEVADFYAPVMAELETLGLDLSMLVSVSAFTTSDVVTDMVALRDDVYSRPVGTVSDWEVGQGNDTFDVYIGRFTTIEYFTGTEPYTTPFGTGGFEFDATGKPLNGVEKSVQFAITVPRDTAPSGGYPIVVYGHGTGGDYTTHTGTNDEGAWLATVGIATIGFDAALHGDRISSSLDPESLITSNVVAAREMIRQTVIDTSVLYRIIVAGGLEVPASVTGGAAITFDVSEGMYMGHSQGSQEAGLLLAMEPEAKSAFLSAGGGGSITTVLEREFNGLPISCTIALVVGVDCDELSEDSPASTLMIQPLLDAADPLHFARHFIEEPLEGSAPRNVVMSEGTEDESTPPGGQEALAVAAGLPSIEPIASTSAPMIVTQMPSFPAPASGNKTVGDVTVTAGLLQWAGEGHFAIYRNADARSRYIGFFESVVAGNPTIPGPLP